MNNYLEQIERERKEAESNRHKLISFLRQHGVDAVDVVFDGYGDSGNIERPSYISKSPFDGTQQVPGTAFEAREWSADGTSKVTSRDKTVDEMVEDLCYALLGTEHGGWEINEGSFGDFRIDVKDDSIALTYNERIEAVNTYEEEY